VLVWAFIWHTRWGYEIRTVGANETAAVYAGIDPRRVVMLAMCLSGALAGFLGINEVMGVHHRLLLNFTAGYGFTGIAVALMGRNHPVGIVLASLLFGMLYQGGAELAFEEPKVTREMVVTIQGLVILFSGALAHMMKGPVERAYLWLAGGLQRPAAQEG
jgi:simple sugar transport system permease protein